VGWCSRLTVNGNGHRLSQDVSILALEGGDLAKCVDLEVVGADTLSWDGGDELDVEAVGLGDREDGGGARVALNAESASARCFLRRWGEASGFS
jgi:hypothetical protein